MEIIESSEFDTSSVTAEVLQAYSTYIHETIHWWQHVGSTSGLLFSLSYLAQCHSSMGELKEVLATIGAKKPLKGYTDQMLLKEGHSAQAKLASANTAVNNALDVEYYKYYAYDPRKHIHWMIEENHFESVGHGYSIVYGQLVGMIADTIDPEFKILPKISGWDAEMQRLNAAQHEGFYWRSPVRLPATGKIHPAPIPEQYAGGAALMHRSARHGILLGDLRRSIRALSRTCRGGMAGAYG